ncbi:tRNA (5-methylaminomethyl-2-thiouridine)(34)-methyltransferase MnmD [Acetivibrio clariflavus]|uniref:MnmC-like methyltransferase domain-containing protein n=1 Tax=Acetivibrio clariflavus (strain DSM 19732 / NBRC 101661 / EBR45) TaxID=720554 RepID=G8LUU6_ACECE|nr:tRNA (5-methylaminomethyl-2-thiouridine)(34)-methyltransferase MnmD [Acetivibrio clariflavus]AEV68476.1 hypothetical protein Clocl_1868 [Acetivibrio clariflavus DSM 19732]
MFIPDYLVNEHFGDRYFDVVNAIDEAQQIHFKNNNLLARIKSVIESNTPFIIGETGFGAGRIVVSLMEYLNKSNLENITIEYNTVELFPLSSERMLNILSGFRNRAEKEIDNLIKAYRAVDIDINGWHQIKIEQPFGCLYLNLWIGEALEMLNSLDKLCDAWFLDGHCPRKNPSMWRPELLMEIGRKTKKGGTCSSYTVSGVVKRALSDAGFDIVKLPGFGGKKEVLQGVKR